MNKPTLLPVLMLAMMFASSCDNPSTYVEKFQDTLQSSFAGGWTKIGKDEDGDTHYVDFNTIKKHEESVYYWRLTDSIKPTEDGDLSSKTYDEVDCGSPRKYRGLSHLFYRESMGKGSTSNTINPKEPEWSYPFPDSVSESTLGLVCKAAELLP